MTMPNDDDRFDHALRGAIRDGAPETASTALRQRVATSLAAAPVVSRARTSTWLLAAATGLAALMLVALAWPRLQVAPGVTPPVSAFGPTTNGSPVITPPLTTPRPEPFGHLGLIQGGDLLTAEDGYIQDMDGHLYMTHSAGAAWRRIDPPGFREDDARGAWFLDPLHGWVTPVDRDTGIDLVIWRTTDGGETWLQSLVGGSGPNANTLLFLDPMNGYLVSDPAEDGRRGDPKPELRWTADGGATWGDPIDLVAASGQAEPGIIDFLDRQHGVMTLPDGLLHTVDGGTTWTRSSITNTDFEVVNGTPRYGSVAIIDATTAFMVIGWFDASVKTAMTAGQTVIETKDGGATWVARYGDARHRAWDFLDAVHWIATDGVTVWSTDDAGASWSSDASIGLPIEEFSAYLDFADPTHGWASAWAGEPCKGYGCQRFTVLFKTADGGQTWLPVGDCVARFACPTPGPGATPRPS
ncbi:MAG TPA: hypothetical protein VFI28_11400 [Candidatus Limnocylindrales bacterium]|nr:hypothetical protein [Candidatus Limnocylindrales bacterium]